LILTHARTRRVWGELRIGTPSRFLLDIPASSFGQNYSQRPRASLTPKGPRIVDGNFLPPASSGQWRAHKRRSRDDYDQRVEYDDEPVYRLDGDTPGAGGFGIGAAVTHSTLGIGRVVAVAGTGKDQKVVVDFGARGRKTVFARFLAAADDSLN
jgi:hypothetical protein